MGTKLIPCGETGIGFSHIPPTNVARFDFMLGKLDDIKIAETFNLTRGDDAIINVLSDKINSLTAFFGVSHKDNSLNKVIAELGTAVVGCNEQWPYLPTLVDYEDVDDIYDFEEIESAFYEATKRQGW